MAGEEKAGPSAPRLSSNADADTIGADDEGLPVRLLSNLRIALPGYSLLHEIARGGQAVVYKAADANGRIVAIKILHNGPFAGAAARQRMEREIITLKSLNHPNIVRVLDSGQSRDGHDYIVMEYINGRPLGDFIGARPDAPVPTPDDQFLLALFRKICAAMAEAHRAGVTHRDLSPSNILIDENYEPHIIDFGLSRTAFDHFFAAGRPEISASGEFMGKLEYASPEQARGSRGTADIRTDVYALGVILYRIVAGGQFPYAVDGTLNEILNSIVNSVPTPPSRISRPSRTDKAGQTIRRSAKLPPPVDPVLEAIVLHALEKDPGNRYQSAGELEQDLARFLANEPTIVHPRRPGRRISRRMWLGVASLGAVACGATIVGRWLTSRHPPAALETPSEAIETPPTPPPPLPRITFGTPEIHGGHWTVDGNDLVQSDMADANAGIVFGDPAWSDYDLTFNVIAMSTSESNGFKALFHCTNAGNFRALALGNASDDGFTLGHCADGQWRHDPGLYRPGKIDFGRLYGVRIEVRGLDVHCFLDDHELFHTLDGAVAKGQVGLATSKSACRFRNIRVNSIDGHLLWNGVPIVDR